MPFVHIYTGSSAATEGYQIIDAFVSEDAQACLRMLSPRFYRTFFAERDVNIRSLCLEFEYNGYKSGHGRPSDLCVMFRWPKENCAPYLLPIPVEGWKGMIIPESEAWEEVIVEIISMDIGAADNGIFSSCTIIPAIDFADTLTNKSNL